MMLIPPVEQFSNNYVFNSLPMFQLNYVTVYVEPDYFQLGKIFIDDLATPSGHYMYATPSFNTGMIYL